MRIASPTFRRCFSFSIIQRFRADKSYRTSPGLTTCVPPPLARMMKEILLRIATVLAEIGVAKGPKLLRCHLLPPGKVFLLQDALDPNIDRKRAQPLVSEKHHAISHLRADPWQLAKFRPQRVIRERA